MEEPSVPFRPGYALGSIVPKSEIKNMRLQAKLAGTVSYLETAIRYCTRRIDEESAKDPKKYKSKAEGLKKKLTELEAKKSDAEDALDDFKMKTGEVNFVSTVESPIDWEKTKLTISERSFDSLKFHSTYVFTEHSSSSVDDFVGQLSGSGSFSGIFASANISSTISARLHSSSKSAGSKGTLLIGAFATTRYVRTFEKIYWDPDKLHSLEISAEEDPDDSAVQILSETIMGGVFIGLVHFKSETNEKRELKKIASEASARVGRSVGVVDSSVNVSSKSASEKEKMDSITNTNVDIEFICYGAVPGFSRKEVKYSLTELKNLNPSEMKLSQEDEQDVKDMVGRSGIYVPFSTDAKRAEITEKQRLKQANAQMLLINTIRESRETEKSQNIHTMESLYEAFESFIKQMKEDKSAGIPVGFNFRVIKNDEIQAMRDKITKEQEMNKLKEEVETKKFKESVRKDLAEEHADSTKPDSST